MEDKNLVPEIEEAKTDHENSDIKLSGIDELKQQKSRNLILTVTIVTFALLVVFMYIAVSMFRTGNASGEMSRDNVSSETATESSVPENDSPDSENEMYMNQNEDNEQQETEDYDNVPGAEANDESDMQDFFKDEYSDADDADMFTAVSDDGDLLDDEVGYVDDYDYANSYSPSLNGNGQFVRVDESYFTDALFIGDSRMYGFAAWSELPATFYSAVGFQLYKYDTYKLVQTEDGKVPLFDAIPYDAFTKIYIKVGLNEMGWGSEEQFEEIYAQFIAKLRETQPRAVIFIHGLIPVTREQNALGDAHNNTNIINRNAALEQFAREQNAYYINVWDVYADAEGYLPTEKSSDGIHLRANYIDAWRECILDHGIVL